MESPARIVFGRVAGAHGLAGEVRVRLFGEVPEPLFEVEEVTLGAGPHDPGARSYRVGRVARGRAQEVRLALAGVTRREAALALGGLLVMAPVEALPTLGDDEFYWFEWIGCRVHEPDGRTIGTVRGIFETGAHDVLVVDDAEGREVLVPAARDWVREVDLGARRIVMEVPPGLLA